MKFNYKGLDIQFFWRYPNKEKVALSAINPETKRKEPIYFKRGSDFVNVMIPDPKRKDTLCEVTIIKDDLILHHRVVKASKPKYINEIKLVNGELIQKKVKAPFIKEIGRKASLRKALREVESNIQIRIEVENIKDLKTAFWNVYNQRTKKLETEHGKEKGDIASSNGQATKAREEVLAVG